MFAKAGASVTIHGRNEEGLKKTLAMLTEAGVSKEKVHSVKGDVSDECVQKALIEEIIAKFGRIDVLVNNAGLGGKTGPDARSLDNYDFIMSVNYDK